MITVYINGCSTCGVNSVFVRQVEKYAKEVGETFILKNSKYVTYYAEEHLGYLKKAGLELSTYIPIVVTDDSIRKLRSWSK